MSLFYCVDLLDNEISALGSFRNQLWFHQFSESDREFIVKLKQIFQTRIEHNNYENLAENISYIEKYIVEHLHLKKNKCLKLILNDLEVIKVKKEYFENNITVSRSSDSMYQQFQKEPFLIATLDQGKLI
jgi:hypothetical protein